MARCLTRDDAKRGIDERAAKPINGDHAATVEPEAQTATEREPEAMALLEVPLDRSVSETEWGLYIHVQLTAKQSLGCRRLVEGLDIQRAKLANGSRVSDKNATAIRWLLEQIADL